MTAPGSNPMARWLEDVWLSRYLDRELSDEEQTWFETYMLDKPHILERVDADTRLGDSLARATESSSAKVSTPPHTGTTLRGKPRSPALAIAASLLLGLGLGLGVIIPGLRNDNTAIIASPPRIVFDTMRGAGTTTLSEAGSADSKLLIVDIAAPFDSRILSANAWINGSRTQLPTPTVTAEGFITFIVPAEWKGKASIEIQFGFAEEMRNESFAL